MAKKAPATTASDSYIIKSQEQHKDKMVIGILWDALRNLCIATNKVSEQSIAISGTIEQSINLGNSAILESLNKINSPK